MSPGSRVRFGLLVSGLRWRAGTALATLLVAVMAVGVGAFGPIYLRGSDQATLTSTLEGAPAGNSGLTLQPVRRGSLRQLSEADQLVPRSPSGGAWFGSPIATEDVGATAVFDGQPYLTDLVARSGVCAHLTMVAGSCRMMPGSVVMSTRNVQELHLGLGQQFSLLFTGSSQGAVLTITGLCAPADPSDPYWWGSNYFGFGSGSAGKPELDDAFTGFGGIPAGASLPVVYSMLQVPLLPKTISVDEVPSFRSSLERYTSTALRVHDVKVSTQVPGLLATAGRDEHVSGSVIEVVDLELFLLVVFVLYVVAARTADERAPDVRLALLRGFRPRSTVAVSLAEPLSLVAAAIPAGLMVAWLAAGVFGRSLFGSGVAVALPLLAGAAAVVSGVVGMVAVALANRRLLAGSDAAGVAAPSPASSTWPVMVETAAVAVAGAAFAELVLNGVGGARGTGADPLSALAPGVVALALGVLGARLLPRLLRAGFRATGRSASVAWTLATRRVARQDAFVPHIVLLALAVALAVFAFSGWAVNARNETVAETFVVGAPKLFTVSVRPGVNFISATRAADPSGRWAMAAVVERASDGSTLAVDASRMSTVMSWPAGLGSGGVRQVARRLVPRGLAPAVEISGNALEVDASAVVNAEPAPELVVDLFDNGYLTPQQVVLGAVVAGPSRYQASIAGLCPSGCRLVDLAVDWNPAPPPAPQSGSVDLDISSISARSAGGWAPVAAGLGSAGHWTTTSGDARLVEGPGGLASSVELGSTGIPVQMAPADVPARLPAVVTPTVSALAGGLGSLAVPGLDSATVEARSVGQVPALPRVGDDAALVDLQTAERFLSGPFADATTEVWLSSSAPPDAAAHLAAQGVTVTGVDSVAARQHASAHGGLEDAYGLFLIAGVASGALAVAATAFAVVVGARSRREELTALWLLGIPLATLRRSLRAEQILSVGTALVLGIGAGLLAAGVSLTTLPEAVGPGPGPPLELGLPWLLLAALVGAMVTALWLAVWRASSLAVGLTSRHWTGRRR